MLKESIYDQFKCSANNCKITCCKGWAIKAEKETLEKWKSNDATSYLCSKVKPRKEDEDFNFKMNAENKCILLDECGLCEIVKKHGDEYLSETCAKFPRKHNMVREFIGEDKLGDVILDEYSLSGACKEVLELLDKSMKAAIVIPKKCRDNQEFPYEYQIRNMMLDIIQDTDNSYSLIQRCFIALSFLHECLECEMEEDVYELIETYKLIENQKEVLASLESLIIDKGQAFLELCQSFLDITEFYKEEIMFRPYLFKQYDFCAGIDSLKDDEYLELVNKWLTWKNEFKQNDEFITKVIAAEIFSDCVSDDLGVIIENYQAILYELCMTQISVFLNLSMGEEVSKETIKEYLSIYIRMIGHNVEGMCEYWEENFEDTILDLEYMMLLLA